MEAFIAIIKMFTFFHAIPKEKCIPFCVMAIHVISCVFFSVLCVSHQNILLLFWKILEGKCYLSEHPLFCFQLYEKNATWLPCPPQLLSFLCILNFIGRSIQTHLKSQWARTWHAWWLARCKWLFEIWQKSWLEYRAANMLERFAKLQPNKADCY